MNFSGLRAARIMADPLSIGLAAVSLVLNGLTWLLLAVRLHPLGYQVPVHYSSLSGFDRLGPWYRPYSIAGFSLGVTIINGILAARAFVRSRVVSFYLLLGAAVVSIFGLIIAAAFSSVS